MAASPLINLSIRSMAASYASLQTAGHNIANASVEGFSRQRVELQTSGGLYTGAGFFGRGVDVTTVSRSFDSFLTKEAVATNATASMEATRAEQLGRLEGIFATGEAGLGYAANQFLNAFVDMAARPQDLSARELVLSAAGLVADRYSAAGNQIEDLQRGVTQDLTNSIGTVNSLAQRLAVVNSQVANAQGSGQTPNDLLDERDRLVRQISSFVQVSTVPAADGSVGVFIAGGQRLVLGSEAAELRVVPDPQDPGKSALGIVEGQAVRVLPPSLLAGGSVAGLLRFQDEDLTAARNFIGQIVVALADRINSQQELGIDLTGAQGGPLFSYGEPRVYGRTGNAPASVAPTVSIVDGMQVKASDYDFSFDGTNISLTRLSDGAVSNFLATPGPMTLSLDGLEISFDTTTLSAGDRFSIQPVSLAASTMRRELDQPTGLAAASPIYAILGPTNRGTASVASLDVTNATPQSLSLTFALAAEVNAAAPAVTAGAPANAVFFQWNDAAPSAATGFGYWVPGSPLVFQDATGAPVDKGYNLTLNGVPRPGSLVPGTVNPGDTITVAPSTAFLPSNNGNALTLAGFRDARFVDGATMTEAYAAAMGNIGVRVQSANTASRIASGVATNAETRRAGQAGVNLDEEAAALIQYQQTYQASARVLQVAQSVFDTLLDVARG